MSYRWHPSRSQSRAFAERMNNPIERAAYESKKAAKKEKKNASSRLDYDTAGGMYIATKTQHDYAVFDRSANSTPEHDDACNQVAYSFSCQEKIPHDYLHIVNELIRSKNT